jgi:hypothetical protein
VTEFERCRPWIEAALEYSGGTHTFDDVVDGITSGRMQFWPAPRGCAVTELVRFPRKMTLNCFLAGGEMDQILDMFEDARNWGRQQGCTAFTLAGRAGWQRVLKSRGFSPTMVVLEAEI